MRSAVEYLPVGCVGKLPCDREHLRVGTGHPGARAFEEWIRAGRGEHLRAEMGNSGAKSFEEWSRPGREDASYELLHRRFVIGEEGGSDLLVGVIRPSADLEQRVYPFALFSVLPRKVYGKNYHLLPLGLRPLWEALDGLLANVYEAASRGAFVELVANARVPAPLGVAEAQDRYESGSQDSAAKLFDRNDGASVAALRTSFGEICARLRKGEGKGSGGLRMSLPVASSAADAAFDTAFWLDLLNRQFFMKRFEPSVFIDVTPGPADCDAVFIFGAPSPQDYAPVMTGVRGTDGVVRPAHGVMAGGLTPSDAADAGSYADLLEAKFSVHAT